MVRAEHRLNVPYPVFHSQHPQKNMLTELYMLLSVSQDLLAY